MLYIERQPSKRSVVLLAILGPLLYLGAMYLFELRASDEGLQAGMAREMLATGEYMKTHLYGRPIREFPLYSWLVCLFSGFQSPTLLSLRLPGMLSVMGLALLCGMSARKLQSNFAGFVAAAVVLMCLATFKVGFRAQVDMLQSFLTCCAWWSWYHLGFEEKRWNVAWEVSLFCVFIGVLNVGLEAVFWFYLPLLFMPRQINAKMRMQMPSHLVSVLFVVVLITVWVMVTPEQPLMPWNREHWLSMPSNDSSGYFWHLISFPCGVAYYLFPWSILLWAPFCIALRQFEKAPIACRYFRVIVFTLFLCVWLFPGTSPLHLLNLLGPMAILIGVHFEIVIRRHQHILNKLVHGVSWGVVIVGILLSTIWGVVALGNVAIMDVTRLEAGIYSGLLVVLSIVVWCIVLRPSSHCTFRTSIIWCIFGSRLLFLLSFCHYNNWSHCDRRLAGEELAGKRKTVDMLVGTNPNVQPLGDVLTQSGSWTDVSSDAQCVYYRPTHSSDFLYLVELFYLDKPIILIEPNRPWERAFPEGEPIVYVLSSSVPALPERRWRAISPLVDMRMRRRATLSLAERPFDTPPWAYLERVPMTMETQEHNSGSQRLQLFEGTLVEK